MKVNKPPVSSSVGIEIKPPKGFSVDGETEIRPREVQKARSSDEVLLDFLYTRLENLEREKTEIAKFINELRAKTGCGGCKKP